MALNTKLRKFVMLCAFPMQLHTYLIHVNVCTAEAHRCKILMFVIRHDSNKFVGNWEYYITAVASYVG